MPSLLFYSALLIAALAALMLARPVARIGFPNRRRAALVLGNGLLAGAVAILLPVPSRHVEETTTRLDEMAPAWQFRERHETRVHAPLARVEAAVRAVTAEEIRLFRLLTWIRNPSRAWSEQPESILAPPARRPILDVALDSGFWRLVDDPRRELVIGTLVIVPPEIARLPPDEAARWRERMTPARFQELAEPGYAKAVMSFRYVDAGSAWTDLSTETRVFATDPGTARRFAAYWRVIYPGSALIRRMWLAAIRQRAEAAALVVAPSVLRGTAAAARERTLDGPPFVDARPFFFALSVADVEVSSLWYRRVFGFETVRAIDLADRGVRIELLRRAGALLELVEDSAGRPWEEVAPAAVERRHLVHGAFKVGFLTDDLDSAAERLEQLGVPLRGKVFAEADGSMRSLQVEDPDGNVVQLFELLEPPASGHPPS